MYLTVTDTVFNLTAYLFLVWVRSRYFSGPIIGARRTDTYATQINLPTPIFLLVLSTFYLILLNTTSIALQEA